MTQDLALEILLSGRSAFLTGAAGAGKTYTLAKFIEISRASGKKVAVTATTGLAATHLGGGTIHSWSGLGILDELPPNFFAKFGKTRAQNICKTDILVIDEISMLHDFQLDLVDQILREIRARATDGEPEKPENRELPFGGIQVVFSGDFFQLPPVKRRAAPQNYDGIDDDPDAHPRTSFAYNARSWRELDPEILYLEQNFRQMDSEFLTILNKIRTNSITRADAEKVAARLNADVSRGGQVTELYTTNRDVDRINSLKMAELKTDAVEYEMTTSGSAANVEKLKKSCLAAEKLELKLDALVMALKNDPAGNFANGSTGTVVAFDKESLDPIVQFRDRKVKIEPMSWELADGDKRVASLTQIPLRPAYAITVHKSQGMTLDAARINLRNVFEPGMGYVALSRVRDFESLSISGLSSQAFFVHPEVLEIDKKFRKKSAESARKLASLIANKSAREKATAQKIAKQNASKSRLEKSREKFPNAGKRWRDDEDEIITKMFDEKTRKKFAKNADFAEETLGSLSEKLGRSRTSIAARISAKIDAKLFDDLPEIRAKYFPHFGDFSEKMRAQNDKNRA